MPIEGQRPTAMGNCCKDCPDRFIGCHSTCERYISAKKEHDRLMKEYRKGDDADRVLQRGYYKALNTKAMAKKKHLTVRRNYK